MALSQVRRTPCPWETFGLLRLKVVHVRVEILSGCFLDIIITKDDVSHVKFDAILRCSICHDRSFSRLTVWCCSAERHWECLMSDETIKRSCFDGSAVFAWYTGQGIGKYSCLSKMTRRRGRLKETNTRRFIGCFDVTMYQFDSTWRW